MIQRKLLNTIKNSDLLGSSRKVAVACSGGADSIALLHALVGVSQELEITVSAVHFNHLIRGVEADRDEEFVRNFCTKYGIEFFSSKGDVPLYAKQNGMSLELAARKLRYEFFETLPEDMLIATAHTASDNLETVILNLVRGTGVDGLCGIPPKRGRFIRPILDCTREEIEDYCNKNNLSFVTDSTNLSDEYTRNKIRHLIVPKLKQINPAAEAAVLRCCKNLREESALIKEIAENYFVGAYNGGKLNLSGFEELSLAVAKRVLRIYCNEFRIDADAFHIESLYEICKNGGKLNMPQNLFAVCKNGVLSIQSTADEKKDEFVTVLSEENTEFLNNFQKIHNLLLNNAVDCDKIVGKLYLRTRKEGDTFKLREKAGTKSLKKLFTEFKIPITERENLPLLCDEEGIIWIYKIGAAQRVRINCNTKKIIKITVEKKDV